MITRVNKYVKIKRMKYLIQYLLAMITTKRATASKTLK